MNRLRSFSGHCLLLLALAGGPLLTSCTQAERQESTADTQDAYTDFKQFVERVTSDSHWHELRADAFAAEMNGLQADYNAKVAAVDRDIDQYTAEQRAEVEQLKSRYATTYEQRMQAFRQQHSEPTTAAGIADPVHYQPMAADYAALPAGALRATYEAFVRNVKANRDGYDEADWRAVEADWAALNARRAQLASQLSEDDQASIAQEKVKYTALKTFSRTKVAEGTRAAKETAKDVGHLLERGAEKVGVAAKGAYRGARDAVREDEQRKEAQRK